MILSAIQRLDGWRRRGLLLAAMTAGAAGLYASPAAAAGPPVFHITMTHLNAFGAQGGIDPATEAAGEKGETFARESGGNTYAITLTNEGEPTTGTVEVADQLPEGMALTAKSETEAFSTPAGWTCKSVHGTARVPGSGLECSDSTPGALAKGASVSIKLYVSLKPEASNPSLNVATVSEVGGGGALEAKTSKGEGETTVTPAVPFGIRNLNVTFFKEPANPLTTPLSEAFPPQAGGHPFAVTTEALLNTSPISPNTTAGPGEVGPAGDGAKEIQVELPPGFSGNPQNIPRCPLGVFEALSGGCPANTAIGYTNTVLSGRIQGGQVTAAALFSQSTSPSDNVLVYNLEPPVGRPAAFGFRIAKALPFVLEAKLRSDRDYGVTVGDSAVGEKPIATKVTICENGAVETSSAKFACKAAPPSSKPFLSNATECSSSPAAWTAVANPWSEPTNFVSTAADTSPLEGCASLQFHPEIEFKPSPTSEGGTTRADEPTGVAVALKLPQTNEAAVDATPDVKNVTMTLPAGMTVSPSAADGLEACSNAQFGLGTEFGPGSKHTEPAMEASCPLASQIGTLEVFTPLLSGAPVIGGSTLQNNQILTCSEGMWSAGKTLSYKWLLNGQSIVATGREYTVTEERLKTDEGKPLQCEVTATNEGGQSVAVSTDLVLGGSSSTAPVPPSSLAAPSGTDSAGNALTCASGAWTNSPTSFEYQWLRNGEAIPSAGSGPVTATSFAYTLGSEDEGKVIQCRVAAKNASGETIADSAAVVVSPVPSSPPPLPGGALQGQLFVGSPECSPCTNADAEDGKLFRLFLQAQNKSAGVIVKLHGTTSANTTTGQLTTTFVEQPQQPFELLNLKLKGGPRATLATPQSCGPATTTADLTPWSTPFTPDANPTSTFEVEGCAPSMPFSPSFNAGTTGPSATTAGGSPDFSLTFGRQDGEQDISGLQVRMPLGLVGKIAGVQQCGEAEVHAAEADTGECPAGSKIGTSDAGAGPGPHPFYTEGNAYLTGPYKGAPFGLAVVTHAIAGPFNLGNVVVRSTINIDPHTAAVTVTSDPFPQIIDGVPLRLRTVNVSVNRPDFMVNPTNCSEQHVAATISALQGASAQVSSPFGLGGCKSLQFYPTFTATTEGRTSKTAGASLDVKITYPPGAYANIGKSLTELPIALPSRLTTIQKACVDTVFEANPAACDEGSVVGHAVAYTPLLANPLAGPAYLVSHGNRAFPDIEIVLQGEGITVDLDGLTDIKKGITKTTFESLPDSPISTFELNLPEGPHSALAAPASLCEEAPLLLPTVLTGQNGAVLKQDTNIAVTGCSPTVALTKAKISGNTLVVTVKTTGKGTVRISGMGLKTTSKSLAAGTHTIRVALTKGGRSMRTRHKKVVLRVKLTVGKQVVAKSTTVKL
jgi:uncharacterized repeat protein (TIGR01451 family)